jgi:hypothetical protein
MGSKDPVRDPLKGDNTVISDKTPFPPPDLYFKVFDSEKDEPESKYREDVFKLYERWEKKYGRKWPENGLNTEDLVWLYEEAYKDEAHEQAGYGGKRKGKKSKPPKVVPAEKELYDGEFITGSEEAAADALASLPADPEARQKAIADAKEEVAEAAWVTDEFESEDYERGNLELLHDEYLWDREGKPTLMPAEPPKEEQGEGSDEWDDFYGSVRPRGVDSDEVRDALWVTDEFESDEDNTESEWVRRKPAWSTSGQTQR